LVERIVVEGPDGPLYDWIKLGLEEYLDPDAISMKASSTTVNEIARVCEACVLRRTSFLLKGTD
jgi:hypothetical protein